jgi:spoIIIJ-associated protein
MTRRSEASGTTLHQAVTDAVAGVLDCEPEKVELDLTAPGLDELEGTVQVRIEVGEVTVPPASGNGDEPGIGEEAVADEAAVTVPQDDEREQPVSAEVTDTDQEPAVAEAELEVDEEPSDGLTPEDLDEEADAAADFLEGLLDAMDLPGDLRLRVHEDHAEVEVVDIGSGALIGRRGQTLEAIQELLRCALQREFQRRARVKVDAEGYRARRLEKLIEKAEEAIDEVLDSGESQRLEPMDVFERKAVHQLVANVEGLTSRSQGREPARRVVIERE